MSTTVDAELERLLQAAADEVNQFGLRRTSVHDIARRAGVSRPTAYRRLGGKDALLQLLLARIALSFWSECRQIDASASSVPERAGNLFVAGMRTGRAHPVLTRLLKEDSDLVVRAWATSDNPQLLRTRTEIAHALDPQGTLDEVQRQRAADLLQRLGLSLLAAPSEVIDEATMRRIVTAAVEAAIGE
jgi:AcrR family transcriptional regulator